MAFQEYRIKADTNSDEKVIHVNLKQEVDVIKILSLELNSEDTYQLHTSGYGVIVGRVLGNGAYGIPNVKVSVFIPLDNDDKENVIISGEYPYATLQTRDGEGNKYNLLPNVTYGGYDGKHKPIGSFPNKRLILDNNGQIEVFDKYWKYTTVTNEVGDYMLFGVPTGVTQVHIDCDISDIGLLSQRPYDLVAKGYDENLFNSMTEFKTDNLENAPQIKSQNKTVTVFPFWGDKDINRIGITRCDVDLDYDFTPCCVFLGSTITDSTDGFIGTDGVPNGTSGNFDTLRTCTGDIEIIRQTDNGSVESIKENVKSIIDGNGVWCYQIPMNLDRIGMDEEGNTIQINTPGKGIPTRARVRFRISLNTGNAMTCKMLVPNNPKISHEVDYPLNLQTDEEWEKWYEFGKDTPECCFRDLYWNKVYSVKQYYPRIQNGPIDPVPTGPGYEGDGRLYIAKKDFYGNAQPDLSQFPLNYSNSFNCIYSIYPSNFVNCFPYNTMYAGAEHRALNQDNDEVNLWFKHHMTTESRSTLKEKGLHFCFENDWVNGCLYFPNVSVLKVGNVIKCFNQNNNKTYLTGRHELRYDKTTGKYISCAYDKNHTKWSQDKDEATIVNDTIRKTTENGAHVFYKSDGNNGNIFATTPSSKKFTKKDLLGGRYYPNGYADGSSDYTEIVDWLRAALCLLHEGYGNEANNVSIEKFSRFSQIRLNSGIIKVKGNVLYYNCGEGTWTDFRRLYATDIINLGNLCDVLDNLPHIYEKLPDSSFTIPPMAPNYELDESGMNMNGTRMIVEKQWGDEVDDDNIDIYGNDKYLEGDKIKSKITNKYDASFLDSCIESYCAENNISADAFSGITKDNYLQIIQYAQERYSLFFGQRSKYIQNYLHYLPTTFVNTSRICELGVTNDHRTYGKKRRLNYMQTDRDDYPINGMIDRFDITDNQIRSEFASLNYDVEKSAFNPSDKRKYFVPTPMYMVDFDGRLKKYVNARKFYHVDENEDKAYIKFRYGDIGNGPVRYRKTVFDKNEEPFIDYDYAEKSPIFANTINEDLILTENSFYFFFGLNYGYSALNKLKGKYCDWDSQDVGEFEAIEDEDILLCHTVTYNAMDNEIYLDLYADGTSKRYSGGSRDYELCKEDDSIIVSGTVDYSNSFEASYSCPITKGYHIRHNWSNSLNSPASAFYGKLVTFKISYTDEKGNKKMQSHPFTFTI